MMLGFVPEKCNPWKASTFAMGSLRIGDGRTLKRRWLTSSGAEVCSRLAG